MVVGLWLIFIFFFLLSFPKLEKEDLLYNTYKYFIIKIVTLLPTKILE